MKDRSPYQLIEVVTQALAHRIRTPLSIVSNELICLLLGDGSDEARRALAGCEQTAAVLKDVLKIVHQLKPEGESLLAEAIQGSSRAIEVGALEALPPRRVSFHREYLGTVLSETEGIFGSRGIGSTPKSVRWSGGLARSIDDMAPSNLEERGAKFLIRGVFEMNGSNLAPGNHSTFSDCLSSESHPAFLACVLLDCSLEDSGISVKVVVKSSVEVFLCF